MTDDLPEEFDLIVVGTGFEESCIAAAASRIGKTVLHLDSNDYYGGTWSSFNIKLFNDLILKKNNSTAINKEITNGTSYWHIPLEHVEEEEEEEEEQQQNLEKITEKESKENNCIKSALISKNLTKETEVQTGIWTQKKLLDLCRHFSIDLVPRVVYSTGQLVKLLISSNICRYAEFRAVDRVCTMYQGHVLSVPCSRSDVFNTSDLNVVEKRLLMKFLNNCMSLGEVKSDEDTVEFRNRSFGEYLKAQNVTDKISTCVRQAIAMCPNDIDFTSGIERTQLFLRSLGQYGNTPFLFPQYGNGELPQCFCRLCAVFGGIYYLNHAIKHVQYDSTTSSTAKCLLHLDTNKCIRAQHVVMSAGNLPELLNEIPFVSGFGELVRSLSRGVFLTTTPLGDDELNSGGGGVILLRLVTKDEEREAIFLQLAHFTGTCPKGLYLLHLTTNAISDNPEADLQPFMQQVFTNEVNTPKIIYSAFFTIMSRKPTTTARTTEQRVFCTSGPQYEIDYDLAIANSRNIFMSMYGKNVEFLPRAPDPEEIVIDGEDPSALNAHELPEDLREQLLALEKNAAEMHVGECEDQQNIDFINNTKSETMDAE